MLMSKTQAGFTLVEVAIVLAIVALLLGGLLIPLATQLEQQRISDTQRTLDNVKEALIGYAIANGRLPCPASSTSNGQESFAAGGDPTNGNCSNFFNGLAPAVTLGITPTDSQGYALDAWGNRIRYAVTTANGNAFTTINGMQTTTITSLTPDLQVCSTSTGISGSPPNCASGTALTTTAPAVIYSLGKNAATGGTGNDEAANPNPNSANNDRVFVMHPPTPSTAANGEFDDIVIWMSPNILYGRMVTAGRLP